MEVKVGNGVTFFFYSFEIEPHEMSVSAFIEFTLRQPINDKSGWCGKADDVVLFSVNLLNGDPVYDRNAPCDPQKLISAYIGEEPPYFVIKNRKTLKDVSGTSDPIATLTKSMADLTTNINSKVVPLPPLDINLAKRVNSLKRRQSIGGLAVVRDDTVTSHNIGHYFKFVNRESESDELFSAIVKLEELRLRSLGLPSGTDPWETLKRDVAIPTISGMSGLGKTRFAREAFHHKFERLAPKDNYSDIIDAASKLPQEFEPSLAVSLVHSLYSGCNLRLDCSNLEFSEGNVSRKLLHEWMKDKEISEEMKSVINGNYGNSLLDTLKFIMNQSPQCSKGDKNPSIIINVDEAQDSSEDSFGRLLRLLIRPLLTERMRVFVVVTGISSVKIRRAIHSSGLGIKEIFLPLLRVDHMLSILESFFRKSLDTPLIRHILWWLGGVPRYLEYFLHELAVKLHKNTKFVDFNREGLRHILEELDYTNFSAILSSVSQRVNMPPSEFDLSSILNFALTNIPVELGQKLCNDLLVHSAQEKNWLYWKKVAGDKDEGIILVPPLIVRTLHFQFNHESIPLLNYFTPASTTRDNEALAPIVLMRKFRVFSLLLNNNVGESKVRISRLGLPSHRKHGDLQVTIPSIFTVNKVDKTVSGGNIAQFVVHVRKDKNRCCAYVNMPTAPFADAFIILNELVIFIQEKQVIEDRKKRIKGKKPSTVSPEEVIEEYKKLDLPADMEHLFLYITDADQPEEGLKFENENIYVLSAKEHKSLFGETLAYLRSAAISWSDVDIPPGV